MWWFWTITASSFMIDLIFSRRLFLAESSLCCLAIAHLQDKAHSVSRDLPWRCSLKWSLTRKSKEYVLKEWLQEGSLEKWGLISWTWAVKLENTLPRRTRQLKSVSGAKDLRMQKTQTRKIGTLVMIYAVYLQTVPGKGRHLENALYICFRYLIASTYLS